MTDQRFHSRRILVVDDQPQIHDTFRRIFSAKDHVDRELIEFESLFLGGHQKALAAPTPQGPEFVLSHAHSGEESLQLVQTGLDQGHPFQVAFVDVRIPCGMDGIETTEQLWQIDASLQVVICTAHSDHSWDDVVARLGANDRLLLLKKPFESDEVRQLALALSEKACLSIVQQERLKELQTEVQRRREAEDELRRMAHCDALTSLPNRPYLLDKLQQLSLSREENQPCINALLFLDLDNFKIINDSLGHAAGDDLLVQVAHRLTECVRTRDGCAMDAEACDQTVRLGGDEFVVLLRQLASRAQALQVAHRIVQRVSEPFRLGDRVVNVGTSVGVAYLDANTHHAHDSLRNADTAMYQAKHQGRGQVAVFDQTMHEAAMRRLEMEEQLRQAIREESFHLHYQPIVNLQCGTIIGAEVLTRWNDHQHREVSPTEFIPIIEEIGMINQLGEWMLKRSMQDFKAMLSSLPSSCQREVYLGVNLSRRQIGDPGFAARLYEILEAQAFDPSLFRVEMTESSDARHQEQSLETMMQLHDYGVGIHIDDFGKGNSSLTCFQSYPIEMVKIDRRFTASITSDHGHAAITQAMVQLTHHLNAKLTAEGVESEAQLKLLCQWGCDAAQGYFFAPPMDIHELRQLICDPNLSPGIRLLRSSPHPFPLVSSGPTDLSPSIPMIG